ncbi:hypothetical protein D3C77_107890 [compost metagenome]
MARVLFFLVADVDPGVAWVGEELEQVGSHGDLQTEQKAELPLPVLLRRAGCRGFIFFEPSKGAFSRNQ